MDINQSRQVTAQEVGAVSLSAGAVGAALPSAVLNRSRRVGGGAIIALAAAGTAACALQPDGPAPGPLRLTSDDRLMDEQRVAGRIWRVYNDCGMARNTTWTSDDGGRRWLKHEGPGFINCTVSSDVRLRPTSRDAAIAEVDQGPEPVQNVFRTRDGGATWTLDSTDPGG